MVSSHNSLWWIFALSVFAIAASMCVEAALKVPNHDLAWLTYVAETWLDGGDLYTTVVETNPPLIIYMQTLAVLAARGMGAASAAITAYLGLTTAIGLGSLALCAVVLRRVVPGFRQEQAVLVLLGCALAFFIYPNFDFGQREHLLLMLSMPYMLAYGLGAPGQALPLGLSALVYGLMAVGVALKPHFVPAVVIIELHWRLSEGRRLVAWDNMVPVGLMAVYGLVIWLFEPDYFTLIGNLRHTYTDLYTLTYAQLLGLNTVKLGIAAVVGLLGLGAVGVARTSRRTIFRLALVLACLLLGALLQKKGWSYHLLPLKGFCLAVLFMLLAAEMERLKNAKPLLLVKGMTVAVGVLVVALLVVAPNAREAKSRKAQLTELQQKLNCDAGGSCFYFFDSRLFPAFPLVNLTDSVWPARYGHLWLLETAIPKLHGEKARPELLPAEERTSLQAIETTFLATLLDDLEQEKPEYLFFPVGNAGPKGDLNVLQYFRSSPGYSKLFLAYEPVGTVQNFVLFKRKS